MALDPLIGAVCPELFCPAFTCAAVSGVLPLGSMTKYPFPFSFDAKEIVAESVAISLTLNADVIGAVWSSA